MDKFNLKDIEAIIFDLGGVILNIDYKLTINAFKKLGITNFDELYSQARQLSFFDDFETGKISAEDFFVSLNKHTGLKLNPHEATTAWNAMLLDLPWERIELLKKLGKKHRLFLLSNTNETHIAAFTGYLEKTFSTPPLPSPKGRALSVPSPSERGRKRSFNPKKRESILEGVFEKVYYSCRIGCRKPDEVIFKKLMEENNLKPAKTLFIDDSYQHIEAAGKLGIKTIYLKKPETIMDIFPKATI